jgi:2-polyprenyl-3-methyl-5-hydroxy-6-metoxy-1,4-benzoquinol methylase
MTCRDHARGKRLLDMPCGDGTLTAIMAPFFERVIGVDASQNQLALAKARLPHLEFRHALIEELDLDEKFDTITMLNVLEHVVDPVAALKKAATFMADDGVLQIHVPNAQAVNRKIAVLMGTLTSCEELSPFDINIAGHRRSYDLASLLRDIERSGLHPVATGGVFYKMLSTPQMDWFLKNGPWEAGGFGWGRVGSEPCDWKSEFCRACYEYGKMHPEDCNVIYVCATRR